MSRCTSYKDLLITGAELGTIMYLVDSSRLKLDSNGYLNPIVGAGAFLLVKWLEYKVRSYSSLQEMGQAAVNAAQSEAKPAPESTQERSSNIIDSALGSSDAGREL